VSAAPKPPAVSWDYLWRGDEKAAIERARSGDARAQRVATALLVFSEALERGTITCLACEAPLRLEGESADLGALAIGHSHETNPPQPFPLPYCAACVPDQETLTRLAEDFWHERFLDFATRREVSFEDFNQTPIVDGGERTLHSVQIGTAATLSRGLAVQTAVALCNIAKRAPKGQILIYMPGYESDPRELWDIKEVRTYIGWLLKALKVRGHDFDSLNFVPPSRTILNACAGLYRKAGVEQLTGRQMFTRP
jgi:hypothetical protein